ncbi:MAG: aminotransferase class IV, partial [Pyrinomonadaceae bacterium]|nr:aminotransferase class IV [Pyrinomonadaceae bacterium]
ADEKLRTSPLATGCLPGTTREFVMEELDCEESLAGPDELRAAGAVFLTSSGLGVVQAAAFEDVTYERSSHPILGLHAVAGRK